MQRVPDGQREAGVAAWDGCRHPGVQLSARSVTSLALPASRSLSLTHTRTHTRTHTHTHTHLVKHTCTHIDFSLLSISLHIALRRHYSVIQSVLCACPLLLFVCLFLSLSLSNSHSFHSLSAQLCSETFLLDQTAHPTT